MGSSATANYRGGQTIHYHQGFDTPAFHNSNDLFKQSSNQNMINTGERNSEGLLSSGIKPYQGAGISNFARYNESENRIHQSNPPPAGQAFSQVDSFGPH